MLRKDDDLITLTSYDGGYPASMLRYKLDGPPGENSPMCSPPMPPPAGKVHFFKDGWEGRDGWYNCTLAESASRDLGDSYDQFVKVGADNGSRDSLDKSHQGKRLYEQMGSKMFLVSRFDSNSSLTGHATLKRAKGPRHGSASAADSDLKEARQQPHHWSTPAVFTRGGEPRISRSSDSDSLESLPREKKMPRAARPSSLYESRVLAARAGLKPIKEQDSDPALRCSCEEEEDIDEVKCKVEEPKYSDEDSSYLHLDRSDSTRRSFVELLKGWEGGSDDKIGQPYDRHQRYSTSRQSTNAKGRVGSDSDNSVSPTLSVVSLSESESDSDIGRSLHGSCGSIKKLAVVPEDEKGTLFRAVSYLKSIDSESSSDEQRPTVISPPANYKDKRPPSVTHLDLSSLEHSDSLDELKACDPFYAGEAREPQSPSNASSGFCSIQVSSSETNSVQESPRETKRSAGSFSSSRSSGYSSGSARSSIDNNNKSANSPAKLQIPKKLSPCREATKEQRKLPKHDEPYEWDPSSSELEELESEGSIYNPKVFESLLDLQRRLGVDLDDSGSSRGSLDKLSTSELLKYSPPTSPTKYKVDSLSDAEKDERCSKLMREYKTTQKIKTAIASGSTVYRTWVL